MISGSKQMKVILSYRSVSEEDAGYMAELVRKMLGM
jgi:hypothetical protein